MMDSGRAQAALNKRRRYCQCGWGPGLAWLVFSSTFCTCQSGLGHGSDERNPTVSSATYQDLGTNSCQITEAGDGVVG